MPASTQVLTLWACICSAIGTQPIGNNEVEPLKDLAWLLAPAQTGNAFAPTWNGMRGLRQPIERQMAGSRAPSVSLNDRYGDYEMVGNRAPTPTLQGGQRRGESRLPNEMRNRDDRDYGDYGDYRGSKYFDIYEMPGICAPLGFWDPMGFSRGQTEGKIRFWRECELKHGRLAMLAAVGFAFAEQVHPMWGGKINVPAYRALQETPLSKNWGPILFLIAFPEILSLYTFEDARREVWSLRSDYEPGDFGFDPLNLKPDDPVRLKDIQTKELNNGRLAMIGFAGMYAQEMATHKKIFIQL